MKAFRILFAASLASCLVDQPGCGEPGGEPGGATAVPTAGPAPSGGAPAVAPAPPKTSSKAKEAPAEVYE